MKQRFALSMFAAGLIFVGANVAKADIITINAVGSPTTIAGGTQWTYQATLTSTEELVPGSTEFFTVYGFNFGTDAAVLTGAPTGDLATDFSSAITPTSTPLTPAKFTSIPPTCSAPSCDNIRFTYTGSTTLSGNLILGTFTVDSSLTGENLGGFYDGQATNTTMGTLNGNAGNIGVPASGVPEPMSLSLLGGGLAALGLMRWRKARKA
ncbi:MAG: PEP-CTERM sorting domain-containing protein [Acidobacteriaceae bacterium]|nr:PEP-CTERM sorting domain-containing protein [Acidobacteriaceae bacterium]